jgi:hypothetical protein
VRYPVVLEPTVRLDAMAECGRPCRPQGFVCQGQGGNAQGRRGKDRPTAEFAQKSRAPLAFALGCFGLMVCFLAPVALFMGLAELDAQNAGQRPKGGFSRTGNMGQHHGRSCLYLLAGHRHQLFQPGIAPLSGSRLDDA